MAEMQLTLFSPMAYRRCDNCGCEHPAVRKYRVYRLCPTCWREIVPEHPLDYAAKADDTEAIAANQRYWAWRWAMDKRYARGQPTHTTREHTLPAGNYNPHCRQCGALTEEYDFSPVHSLFGKSRHRLCPVCEARDTNVS